MGSTSLPQSDHPNTHFAMKKQSATLARDAFYLTASIAIAYVLGKTDAVGVLVNQLHLSPILAALVAGLFFTSVFTTAPAIVALAEIALHNNLWLVALAGGFGALLGDVIIFRFVRDHVADDLLFLFNRIRAQKRMNGSKKSTTDTKAFRWLVPVIGALIIASPLPDELGITILGLSKIKMWQMIPLTFVFNTIGIVLIGLVARTVV